MRFITKTPSGFKDAYAKLDLAWLQGTGPNQTVTTGLGFGADQGQDFAVRLDLVKLWPGLVVGGSYYVGESFKAAGTPAFPSRTISLAVSFRP